MSNIPLDSARTLLYTGTSHPHPSPRLMMPASCQLAQALVRCDPDSRSIPTPHDRGFSAALNSILTAPRPCCLPSSQLPTLQHLSVSSVEAQQFLRHLGTTSPIPSDVGHSHYCMQMHGPTANTCIQWQRSIERMACYQPADKAFCLQSKTPSICCSCSFYSE